MSTKLETLNENQAAPKMTLAEFLAGMSPNEQLAAIAEADEARKIAAAAIRKALDDQASGQLAAINDILSEDDSIIFLNSDYKPVLVFQPATAAHVITTEQGPVEVPAGKACWRLEVQTVVIREERARRSAAGQRSNLSPVDGKCVVDGREYISYSAAYYDLGYKHPGYSFNARALLKANGHVTGPATR